MPTTSTALAITTSSRSAPRKLANIAPRPEPPTLSPARLNTSVNRVQETTMDRASPSVLHDKRLCGDRPVLGPSLHRSLSGCDASCGVSTDVKDSWEHGSSKYQVLERLLLQPINSCYQGQCTVSYYFIYSYSVFFLLICCVYQSHKWGFRMWYVCLP